MVAFLACALATVYLALKNGGYDIVERSEVGIAVWWILLVGSAVGALSLQMPQAARLLTAVFLGFTGWTAISLGWTESDERTMIEVARVVTYLGVFTLAIVARRHWRAMLAGIGTAMALVVMLSVLSRLQPNLFPAQTAPEYFPGVQLERRLSYPLNYSTGVAVLAAMAVPLLLSVATAARALVFQAAAAAVVPVALLAVWLTASSLAIPLAVLALVGFIALAADRVMALTSVFVTGIGSTLLILGLEQRDALDSGIVTPAALQEGNELLAMLLVVCFGVALINAGVAILNRVVERPGWMRGSRRRTTVAVCLVVLATAGAVTLTPLRGEISDGWDRFTSPSEVDAQRSSRVEQILDPSSNGRYQFWETALAAGEQDPLTGIGAGSFEFWWSRERDSFGFARDAHSLFMETFAELGLVGVALIAIFCVGVVAVGLRRLLQAGPAERQLLAGVGAAFLVFVVAAAVDWMWELAVLPVVALVLAAIWVCGSGRPSHPAPAETEPLQAPPWQARIAVCLVAAVGILAIAVPLSSTTALHESRTAAAASNLDEALRHSRTAGSVEPYAASPELQRALILEQQGRFDDAAVAARAATRNEATNWRTWLILSRVEAEAGNAEKAVDAYRRARSLNPHSALFSR